MWTCTKCSEANDDDQVVTCWNWGIDRTVAGVAPANAKAGSDGHGLRTMAINALATAVGMAMNQVRDGHLPPVVKVASQIPDSAPMEPSSNRPPKQVPTAGHQVGSKLSDSVKFRSSTGCTPFLSCSNASRLRRRDAQCCMLNHSGCAPSSWYVARFIRCC